MDLDRSAPIVVENEWAQHTVAVTRAAAVMPVVGGDRARARSRLGGRDGEGTLVVAGVVVGAEADQVVVVGAAAVFPMVEVMDLDKPGRRATGVCTAPVAVFDQAAGPSRNPALGASDVDGFAVAFEDDSVRADAGIPIGEVSRDRAASVEPRSADVEVEVNAVTICARDGLDRGQ